MLDTARSGLGIGVGELAEGSWRRKGPNRALSEPMGEGTSLRTGLLSTVSPLVVPRAPSGRHPRGRCC